MNEVDDNGLLRKYALQGCEQSFQQLVARHIDLVYGTSFRVLKDSHFAQEVAQNVFIVLAQKARFLGEIRSMPAWLHRASVLEAKAVLRREIRRDAKEAAFLAATEIMKNDTPSLMEDLSPVLDESLESLNTSDRQILLLRYLKSMTLKDVGAVLGITEDAARKRVQSALAKLTVQFEKRGFRMGGSSAVAAILASAPMAAPPPLAAAVAHLALAQAAAVPATSLGLILTKVLYMTKLQTTVVGLAACLVPIAFQQWDINNWENKNHQQSVLLQSLQGQLDAQEKELERWRRRRLDLGTAAAQLASEKTPAFNAGFGSTTGLWDEKSPIARIPKSILQQITITTLNENLQVTQPITELLGLTSSETVKIHELINQTKGKFQALETSLAKETDEHIKWFRPDDGPKKSFLIPAFAQQGAALSQELHQSLDSILGGERADILWHQSMKHLNDTWREFGKHDTKITLHLNHSDPERPRVDFHQAVLGTNDFLIRGNSVRDKDAGLAPFILQTAQEMIANKKTTKP